MPNLLSGLRLLAAPFAAWAILNGHDTIALLVFAAAGLSDGLDGFIARAWGVTSGLGAWLDPVADKLLMLFCLAALYAVGAVALWLLALVAAASCVNAAGWLLIKALGLPVAMRSLLLGKASTAVQILYALGVLLLLAFDLDAPSLVQAGAWVCGAFTLLSAGAYAGLFLRGVFAGRPFVS